MINGLTADESAIIGKFIEDITTKQYWAIGGVSEILFDTYINIEYKYFEGFNVPMKVDKEGKLLEDYKKAHTRMKLFIGLKNYK